MVLSNQHMNILIAQAACDISHYSRRIFLVASVVVSTIVVIGCATGPRVPEEAEQSVSIPYDPYNYDPEQLDAEAQAHCDAYGLRAVFEDETIDNQSVRWRYRHYRCV